MIGRLNQPLNPLASAALMQSELKGLLAAEITRVTGLYPHEAGYYDAGMKIFEDAELSPGGVSIPDVISAIATSLCAHPDFATRQVYDGHEDLDTVPYMALLYGVLSVTHADTCGTAPTGLNIMDAIEETISVEKDKDGVYIFPSLHEAMHEIEEAVQQFKAEHVVQFGAPTEEEINAHSRRFQPAIKQIEDRYTAAREQRRSASVDVYHQDFADLGRRVMGFPDDFEGAGAFDPEETYEQVVDRLDAGDNSARIADTVEKLKKRISEAFGIPVADLEHHIEQALQHPGSFQTIELPGSISLDDVERAFRKYFG